MDDPGVEGLLRLEDVVSIDMSVKVGLSWAAVYMEGVESIGEVICICSMVIGVVAATVEVTDGAGAG